MTPSAASGFRSRRGDCGGATETATAAAQPVGVVIVSCESAAVLGGALASLPENAEAIVVDNDSRDRSAVLAEEAGATVLRNTRNLGFGSACNRGAEIARAPLILFLNPDARLTPGSLDRLIEEILSDPSIAAVGPLLQTGEETALPRKSTLLESDRGAVFAAIPSGATDVGFLSGAALLVRSEPFREVGGFDENIFLYLEDDDLCRRLRGAGYRLRLAPSAVAMHERTPESSVSARSLRFRNRHTMVSMRYLAKKHGVRFDVSGRRGKAWRRLAVALLTLDRVRIHKNIGRLQGLGF